MLDLSFEQPTPALLVLRWRENGVPTDAEAELLERVAASFRPGTHLVVSSPTEVGPFPACIEQFLGLAVRVAPIDAPSGPAPDEPDVPLGEVTGLGLIASAPLALVFVRGSHEGEAVAKLVVGPPGHGGTSWVLAPGDDGANLIAVLQETGRRRELEQVVNTQREHLARALPRELTIDRAEHPALDGPHLDVGFPDVEREFQHQIHGGGELTSAGATDDATTVLDLGRLVRGREQFTLPLPERDWFRPRTHLVLVRRTAPADHGRVLRVVQDELEDLGPWHLGHGASANVWSMDTFRIAPELLDSKSSTVLSFECEPGTTVASMRYSFLLETEPDGLWLTELEPDQFEGPEPGFDRTIDGRPLIHDGRLHLRGLGCRAPSRLTYELPAGYGSFETVPLGAADIEFEVTVNDARRTAPAGQAFHCDLPGACTLTLACRGPSGVSACWATPVLLRS